MRRDNGADTPAAPVPQGRGVCMPTRNADGVVGVLGYVGGWGVPEHSVGNHRPPETGPGQRTGLVRATTPGSAL